MQRVVEATTEYDGHFVMGLVTVRHSPTQRLEEIKKLVTESFAAARRGAPWERIRVRGNVAGVLVAPEVTHGTHGWHLHIHFGMPCMTSDEEQARTAGEALVQRFMRAVAVRGGTALRRAQGIEIAASPEAAGEYIAKGTSWELASANSGHKTAVAGRTPWDIAEDAILGDVDAFRLWREFAEVMPVTRSCVITPRLASLLGIAADDDDEETGEHVPTEDAHAVGTVPTDTWKRILRFGLSGTFLSRIETDVGNDSAGFDAAFVETMTDVDALSKRIEASSARRRAAEAELQIQRDVASQARAAREIATRVAREPWAGTRVRIARAIEASVAANPGSVVPTAQEVLRELAARS